MSRHVPSRKTPPTKDDIVKLVDACQSPGAKLTVALAAFSGLGPGHVKKLVFRNLVEFSLPKKQFLEVPSRIQMMEAVGNRRSTVVVYYTFLSSRGCEWFLEDLRTRTRPLTAQSLVVAAVALREAEKVIHAAGLRWHDLRDYFHVSFVRMSTSSTPVAFLLGHVTKEDDLTHVWRFFEPQRIKWMRDRYAQVEMQFFV